VGNTLEAVVGALLLRRVTFNPRLERVRDVLALVVLAAAGSTTIAATNGVTTLWVSGNLSGSYGAGWFLWWTGDAMGDLIVAPLLLLWLSMPFWKPRRVELFEAFALLALIAVVSWFVFLHGYWRYPHLLFPLLIWAALRFSQRGAVTGSFVVAAFAIKGAIDGTTPLTGGSATEVVQVAEGLLAAVIVSLLFLGAALSERRSAEVALQHERANLAEAQELALGLVEATRTELVGHLLQQAQKLDRLLSDLLDLDSFDGGRPDPPSAPQTSARARPPGRRRLPNGWPPGRSQCPTGRRRGRRSEARADRREPLGERGQVHAAGNRRGRPSRTGGSGPANRSGRLGRRRSGG
jgi:MASE1